MRVAVIGAGPSGSALALLLARQGAEVTLFSRFGAAEAEVNPVTNVKRDKYYSFGLQIQNALVFNPLDTWGVGYAESRLANDDMERIGEGYYNIRLSEKLRLSFHLAHVFESPAGANTSRFLIPAIRLQASF